MDLNYSTLNIFPVPIHVFDVNGFKEIQNQLIDYAYNLKEKDEGVTISNVGGWHSTMFEVKNVDDVLQKFLINCLAQFPALDKSVSIKVFAWVNINKPGDYNSKHNHPGDDLAGVLWIKTPENSGNLVFESPYHFNSFREICSYSDRFKKSSNIDYTYYCSPSEGIMIVFPAHLQHHVIENNSNEDRISVSFNIRLSKLAK